MDNPFSRKTSEPALPATVRTKRPATSLLPAFEPLSSSPGLPRMSKKMRTNASTSSHKNTFTKYPTPVPTSSTGILSSSPPGARIRNGPQHLTESTEPNTKAAVPASAANASVAVSALSERAPLSAVPSIELNENGETLLMGRSSNSTHFQLSANRLISRVHVRARYIPSTHPLALATVEIVCSGWNGLTLHCQGRTWELSKGDTFTSETENAELMVDVQDARVRIQWPSFRKAAVADAWDSPRSTSTHAAVAPNAPGASALQSSPMRRSTRIASPESPTPAGVPRSNTNLQALLSSHYDSDDEHTGNGPADSIEIYEDASGDEAQPDSKHMDMSFATEFAESYSSELSEPHSDDSDGEHANEENDPIVHSFGPFGADLSNRLASITAASPMIPKIGLKRSRLSTPERAAERAAKRAKHDADEQRSADGVGLGISVGDAAAEAEAEAGAEPASPQVPVISARVDVEAVRNHLVNQLAFSRLSSSPLSTIMNNLPEDERRDLTRAGLRYIIEQTVCVGVIERQGKDAAGQALESEYYYVSDKDSDLSRRQVVDGMRKPSLRACRKQHKQYYWKRPRTP